MGCHANTGCTAWQLFGGTSEATTFRCLQEGEEGPTGFTSVKAYGDCEKQIEDACEGLEDCGTCTSQKVLTDYDGGFDCKYCNTGATVGIDTGSCGYECISEKVSIANEDCDKDDETSTMLGNADGDCTGEHISVSLI